MAEDLTSKQAIEAAAFRLFSEQGLDATSYTAIAEASGCGRPLVQYHFPKKEDLAVAFVERCLLSVAEVYSGSDYDVEEHTVRVLRMGQLYYELILNGGMRAFMVDALANRNITSRIIRLNAEWSLPYTDDDAADPGLVEASIKATGGIYELLHASLSEGLACDAADLAAQNVAAYLVFTQDLTYAATLESLRSQTIGAEAAAELASAAASRALA